MKNKTPGLVFVRLTIPVLTFLLLVAGCAIAPPVQEMSDARQAIRAAVEADAGEHAPQKLRAAELLMDSAARNLEKGEYEQARQAALAARETAIQARDKALSAQKKR